MGGFLPQQPIISWLCARKVKETLRSHVFLMIWCSRQYARYTCMDFVVLVVSCALLVGPRAYTLVSQRLMKGQFHKLYEYLRLHNKIHFCNQ
jgi:hypothetical protein